MQDGVVLWAHQVLRLLMEMLALDIRYGNILDISALIWLPQTKRESGSLIPLQPNHAPALILRSIFPPDHIQVRPKTH